MEGTVTIDLMVMTLSKPNSQLRAVRLAMRMSQAEFAKAVQKAGRQAGEPNTCSVQNVQRWEAGAEPRGPYLRALETVTGQPAENLGFRANERYELDIDTAMTLASTSPGAHGPLSGIWLSRYEYESSGRNETFTDLHHVLVLQHGDRVQVRSLAESAPSELVMDLTQNGHVLTGKWTERTNQTGYYQGAVYHGAIQLLLEPSGRRMAGKWAGFGRDWDVNTGPWTLTLITADTSPEAIERYNRPAEED